MEPKHFILFSALKIFVVFSVLMTIVAYAVWVERKVSAAIQDRIGPNRFGPFGLMQPAADAIKASRANENGRMKIPSATARW